MTQVTIQGQTFQIDNEKVVELLNWLARNQAVKTPNSNQIVGEIAKFEGKELING